MRDELYFNFKALKEADIGSPEVNVFVYLMCIVEDDNIVTASQKEIAKQIKRSRATVNKSVVKLIQQGLVEKIGRGMLRIPENILMLDAELGGIDE